MNDLVDNLTEFFINDHRVIAVNPGDQVGTPANVGLILLNSNRPTCGSRLDSCTFLFCDTLQ